MNKVLLIGNIASDIEIRTTQAGILNATFRIAVQRRFKNAQGQRETDFLNIVCWRQTAEYCQKYLEKGRKIAVEGSIQTRSYETQDGSRRTVTEIVAENVEALEKFQQTAHEAPTVKQSDTDVFEDYPEDDLPF